MKSNATLILLVAAILFHTNAHAYAQGITLNVKDEPLSKVFDMIQGQSKFTFIYSGKMLSGTNKVSLNVTNEKLEKVLEIVFDGQPLKYEIDRQFVIVKLKTPKADRALKDSIIGNPGEISGTVTNERGEAVAGATIYIEGKNVTVATDMSGNFSITGIEGKTALRVTSVGYEAKRIIVSNKISNLTIRLVVTAQEMKAVTVSTGYQTFSKEKAVGSYSKLDSLNYSRRSGMDILSRLDGTVNSLYFDKKSGVAPLQIRGISTINGNKNPLVVIDNFPIQGSIDDIYSVLNSLNPNDVQDVTVLRDAAATSIWGIRAGNGVLVINTKKGKFNQPQSITVSSNFTLVEKPNLFYVPQMPVSDYIEIEKFLFSNEFRFSDTGNIARPVFSPVYEILFKVRNGAISSDEGSRLIDKLKDYDLRSDLENYVYRNSLNQQHYANIVGGSNYFGYSLSLGFNSAMPNVRGSKSGRQFTVNSTNNFRPLKDLDVEAGINYSKSTDFIPGYAGDVSPFLYQRLIDESGNHLSIPKDYRSLYVDTAGMGKLLDWQYRPLDELQLADNKTSTQSIRLNMAVSYKFTNWLKAELRYLYANQFAENRNYQSEQTYFTRNLINLFTNLDGQSPEEKNPLPLGGILTNNNNRLVNSNARAQLSIIKGWNGKHEINGLLAWEISESKSYYGTSEFYGYNSRTSTSITYLNYGQYYPIYGERGSANIPNGNVEGEGTHNRFVSLLGNAAYTFDKKYTVYGSARRDGANVFGVNTNRKWKPLWSIGASWDITQEKFYELSWLPSLRIHGSFGYAGNAGSGTGLPIISYSNSVASYTRARFATIGRVPNPNLRWEQVRSINLGIDFGLNNNRISGSFDWFQKKSTDLLANAPIDPTSGVSTFFYNIGNLKSNGFDIQINSRNLVGEFQWSSTFGLSYNKTIVTKFNSTRINTNDFINYGINPVEGRIAWGISSYRWRGLDPENGDPIGYFQGKDSKEYSSIIYDSLKNQIFHGSSLPLYSGFFTNYFQWKGFSVSTNIVFKLGYYFRKPTISYSELFYGWNGNKDFVNRWKKPGDEVFTNVPSMTFPSDFFRDDFYKYSEVNVERGDHFRLQDVRISYNWDNRKIRWIPIQSFQFYVYVNNLNIILWKANKSGLDPEFTGGSNPIIIPPSKSLTCGVSMRF